ncbi:MAG: L,D-transpeptidase family protein, partial [Verrucomicrobiota bacterium]
WVDAATGRTVVSGADRRRTPQPPGTVWKGTPVPLWQRVTGDGIGMHVGRLPGYPASHGCIRFPGHIMPLFYAKTKVGTPISVVRDPFADLPSSIAKSASPKPTDLLPVTGKRG